MRFRDLIDDTEARMNNTEKTTLVKQWLNDAQDEVQSFFDWPFLLDENFLQTTATYTTGTGTINVTNGSTAVSGTGTAWTAAMTGRKFRITGDNEWYTFTQTAATTGTLDRNYEGTTSTTANYQIYQDVYKVPANVNKLKLFRNLGQQLAMLYASPTEFDHTRPTVTLESTPRIVVVLGRGTDTYTTGTVAGTSGASTITGTTTEWASTEGITIGSKIEISDYTYTVKSVDSDTQLTIYELLQTTPSGTSYQINLSNIEVQLWPPPEDSEGLPFRFFRSIPPLVGDGDESQIPEKYHRILVEGACKRAFIYQFDQAKYQLAKAEFNEGLLLMKADFRQTKDKVNVMRSDDAVRLKGAALIPDNFGTLA